VSALSFFIIRVLGRQYVSRVFGQAFIDILQNPFTNAAVADSVVIPKPAKLALQFFDAPLEDFLFQRDWHQNNLTIIKCKRKISPRATTSKTRKPSTSHI
jgi:hypothetical protein